jgi:hypothetical protein
MKLSTVFRRAYELVATGQERYSCDAILRANTSLLPTPALLFYREHFTPAVDSPEHYWLRGTEMIEAEKHEWRLTALCFAAAITKSENL